jgi:hypothetical protein
MEIMRGDLLIDGEVVVRDILFHINQVIKSEFTSGSWSGFFYVPSRAPASCVDALVVEIGSFTIKNPRRERRGI